MLTAFPELPPRKSLCGSALETKLKMCLLSQVAAEYNRANAARVLIEEGAPAGVMDDSGMSALVLLIKKMPSVVSVSFFKNAILFCYGKQENKNSG